jgi:membrane protease YdiL (CAAX protease family)
MTSPVNLGKSNVNTYLDLARLGRTGWLRHILAIGLILFLWQVIGALPSVILIFLVSTDGNPKTTVSASGQFSGVEPVVSLAIILSASVLFLIGIFLAIRFIHLRPFRTLITPESRISWGRIFQGFIVWVILLGVMSLVEVFLYPGRYIWTLNFRQFIPFSILALLLIPIQASAEELFFRGYLLQSIGLRLRNIWILSFLSGLVFMLPHLLNPEARVNFVLMGFYYFFIGAVMAFVTLRDGRLELAIGLHIANNLFSALVANYSVTVLPTPSMFTVKELDATYSVIAATVGLVLFMLIFISPARLRFKDNPPD